VLRLVDAEDHTNLMQKFVPSTRQFWDLGLRLTKLRLATERLQFGLISFVRDTPILQLDCCAILRPSMGFRFLFK